MAAKPKTIAGTRPTDGHRLIRRSALAAAIAAIVTPNAHSEDWGRNVELFVAPTTKRNLFGGQLLQPLRQNADSLLYFDFRGTFNPGDTDELNVGFGYRRMFADRNWILGGYSAFDTRTSLSDRRYNQVTFGVEGLSDLWDVRANYYLPLTDEKRVGSIAPTASGSGVFTGFNLIQPFTAGSTIFEEALEGGEIEGGRLLDFIPFGETRLFVGAYYFDGDTVKSTGTGLKARLEFRPRKDIIFNVLHQHDDLFGTETMVQVRYSFGNKREGGVRSLSERMIQFVERDVDVKETSSLPFRNRTLSNGADVDTLISDSVVHIDNTAPSGGDGSFENPYDSIAACEVGGPATCGDSDSDAIIYVHAGDGTSLGLDQTLELQDQQKLIGQGWVFYGIGGDQFPLLQPGGNGIVLANDNEVAGLHIDGGNIGILGENVTGFNIHDNQLTGNSNGIVIATFTNSSVSSSGVIAANSIMGNSTGIYLYNGADGGGNSATQSIELKDNIVTGNETGLLARNIAAKYGEATQTIDLSAGGNQFNNNVIGARFFNFAADESDDTAIQIINLAGADNQFNNNEDTGIYAANVAKYDSTANQTIDLSGGANQFNGNGDENAAFYNGAGKYSTAAQTIDMSGGANQFNGGEDGLLARNIAKYSDATQSFDLSGGTNQFNDNAFAGATIINTATKYGTATQIVNLAGGSNQMNGNGDSGLVVANLAAKYGTATQTVNLSATNSNQATGNGKYGVIAENGTIDYDDAFPTQSVDLTGADLSGNGDGPCAAYNEDGSQTITGAECEGSPP